MDAWLLLRCGHRAVVLLARAPRWGVVHRGRELGAHGPDGADRNGVRAAPLPPCLLRPSSSCCRLPTSYFVQVHGDERLGRTLWVRRRPLALRVRSHQRRAHLHCRAVPTGPAPQVQPCRGTLSCTALKLEAATSSLRSRSPDLQLSPDLPPLTSHPLFDACRYLRRLDGRTPSQR